MIYCSAAKKPNLIISYTVPTNIRVFPYPQSDDFLSPQIDRPFELYLSGAQHFFFVHHFLIDRFLHQMLRFGIERRRGLFQDQEFVVSDKGTRNDDELFLFAAQLHTPLSHEVSYSSGHAVIKLWQLASWHACSISSCVTDFGWETP
mmetsp:Transcript_50870/g.61230  ORF Transcript_50870/g.61230 Transcript_50870/m.61230 type:complete len:147 (+) Transcript_50870:196-636(+)